MMLANVLRRASGLCGFAVVLLNSAPVAAEQVPVDLELMLAIDTSSSINKDEFRLQVDGLAAAFRHPAVIAAIGAAGNRGIAVAVMQWAEAQDQLLVLPWVRIADAESAHAVADRIIAIERQIPAGPTAISSALAFAIRELESNAFDGLRRVIDLSGDGRANHGPAPAQGRDLAVSRGITVNGLAILNEIPLLDRYYRNNVIGGTGAFVMVAKDWRVFAEAMIEKLIKEISQSPVASGSRPRSHILVRGSALRPWHAP